MRPDWPGPLHQEFVDHLLGQVFISQSFPVEVPFCQIIGWTKRTEFNGKEMGVVFVKSLNSLYLRSNTHHNRIIDEKDIILGLNEPIYDICDNPRVMQFRLIRICDPKTDLTNYFLTSDAIRYRHCPESCLPGKIFEFGKVDLFDNL